MSSSGALGEASEHDHAAEMRADAEASLERVRDFVRHRPLVSVAAACAVGAALGGIVFSRLGRLVFIASLGYVANELWHREGRFDIHDVIERLSR